MNMCWINRFWASLHWEPGQTLPAPLRRHVGKCPCCRQYFLEQERICQQLGQQAQAEQQSVSPWLHGKIMARLSRQTPSASPVSHWTWHRSRRMAAATVGLMILLALLVVVPLVKRQQRLDQTARTNAALSLVQAWSAKVSPDNRAPLEVLGMSLTAPLESEVQSVKNDARTVVQGLAKNFLPEQMRSSLLNPPSY